MTKIVDRFLNWLIPEDSTGTVVGVVVSCNARLSKLTPRVTPEERAEAVARIDAALARRK